MTVDFDSCLGAVDRTVIETEREGKPARNVALERVYDTTPDDLWDAVTSPERLARWFLPISGDLRPGGKYQFDGNAGGTITDCFAPRFVAATWEFGGGVSWVEVRIAAEGDSKSRLTLSHICPVDDHWKKYGPGAVGVGYAAQLLDTGLHQAPWRLPAGPDGLDMDSSRQVCTCFGVSETRIREALLAGAASAAELGRTLRCGTNCGSCVPELNALIAAVHGSESTEVSHAG